MTQLQPPADYYMPVWPGTPVPELSALFRVVSVESAEDRWGPYTYVVMEPAGDVAAIRARSCSLETEDE
jgi:hypothetical protein